MTSDTVFGLLEQAAATWPGHIAVTDRQGDMTFRDLLAEATRLRDQLVEAGIGPGTGLGLMAENGRGFIIGLFAGAGAGATVMPVSHQLKPHELAGETELAGLHAILSDGKGPTPTGHPVLSMDLLGPSGSLTWTGKDRGLPMVRHVEAHFVRFTSGTTGSSKGVVLSNRSVLERTAVAQEQLQLGPEDAVVWVLPMAFHFVVSIILYVRYGARIVVCENLLAKNILEAANRHGGTLLYAAPMQIRLLAADKSGETFRTLRRAISTSSSLPSAVADAFQARYGFPVRAGYGIIEAGLPILNQRTDPDEARALGDAMPSFEVGILNPEGVPCGPGETGQLALRGPGMFEGYLNPPLRLEDVVTGGWFFTGDLARRDATGLIHLEGREKSMINVSGNKVFPEEVEAILEQVPGVVRARVYGVEHPMFGELVNAEVQLEEGAKVSEATLHKYCNQRLSTYKVPQRIHPVAEIALTSTGKVKRTT